MIEIDGRKSVEENLTYIKSQCLVVDLECCAFDGRGYEINIQTDFEKYVACASVKWLGLFSFRDNKKYIFEKTNLRDALPLLQSHSVLVTFNGEDFDCPILFNNGFLKDIKQYLIVDCMVILGNSNSYTKKGFPFKQRGVLMEYDFESNSLRNMAKAMGLETQKGDIDYRIFQKNAWTPEETIEIEKYLSSDVMATKQMFDKLWAYWLPFIQFLPPKSIYDLSWIKGSIASVIYKAACHLLGVEPTYAEKTGVTEEKGGNVILPTIEEGHKVWYVDFSSLYPHLMICFNVFAEVPSHITGPYIWHGNDVFKVKGYYDISHPHPLSKLVTDFLKKRTELKITDKDNPLIYTYKIFCNGLYGVVRSQIFEKVHKPSAGWDICDLGQQCQKILVDMMAEFGFKTVYGDTDSAMLIALDEKNNNEIYVKECLQKVINKILDNAPFKVATFKIAIEHYIDYMSFIFEEAPVVGTDGKNIKVKNRLVKERKGKKKHYYYIWTDKNGKKNLEVKGLPVIKTTATALGFAIYDKVLTPLILKQGHGKFPKEQIDGFINSYLRKTDAMDLISQEYKVKPSAGYKKEGQIQGQISRAYFNGSDGVIRLIKNKKVGKVGKGATRYCSIEEALLQQLQVKDLDLTKVYKELRPFIIEPVSETPEIGAKNEIDIP